MRKTIRFAMAAALTSIGWLGLPGIAQANTTAAATIYSQAGDWVGKGQTTTIVDLIVKPNFTGGIDMWSPTMFWTLSFSPPTGQNLAVGEYTNAKRFATPLNPAMDIGGNGAGCNTTNGTFWIDDLQYDTNNSPSKIGVRFEFHCESALPALYGGVASTGANLKPIVPPKASAVPTPPTIAGPAPTTPATTAPQAPPTTAAAAPDPSGVQVIAIPTDPTPVKKLSVGMCAKPTVAKGVTTYASAPCNKPHKAEVYGSWRNAFTADLAQAKTLADNICALAYKPYVGTPVYDSKLGMKSVLPTLATWSLGDRSLVCLIMKSDGSNLPAGSVKGTNQ